MMQHASGGFLALLILTFFDACDRKFGVSGQLYYCGGLMYGYAFPGCTYGFYNAPVYNYAPVVVSPVVVNTNPLYLCNGAYYTYPFGGCTYNNIFTNTISAPISLPFSPIGSNTGQAGTPQIAPIGSTNVAPGQIGPLPAGSGTNPTNPVDPTNNLPIDTVVRPGSQSATSSNLLPRVPQIPNGIAQIVPIGTTPSNGQVGPL